LTQYLQYRSPLEYHWPQFGELASAVVTGSVLGTRLAALSASSAMNLELN
jgi:hypothetical protein